jgi:transposase
MHLTHKPGESMQVDWAGQSASIVDGVIGEMLTASIFVATLPCSGYSYAEAFLNQTQESWTTAHIHAFEYFGGTVRILVPDNLKTGVENPSRNELVINKTYSELAEHYGCTVIPARVKKPRDYEQRCIIFNMSGTSRKFHRNPTEIEDNNITKIRLSL